MEKEYTTFEEILDKDGVLIYYNTGNSMMPLLRQQRYMLYEHLWCDLFIVRAPIVFLLNRYNRLRTRHRNIH